MLLRLDARWHYLKGLLDERNSLQLERLEAVKVQQPSRLDLMVASTRCLQNTQPYEFLNSLAQQLLNDSWTQPIVRAFAPLMLDLTTR